ncbi:MAG TPA: radical SAM protein [Chryseosolibacter sp.]
MNTIFVKSILNKKKKRDSWFLDDYTLNPYEGCSMNCQYCYIRGSKYGENMAESLSAKVNGVEVLDRQLAFRVKKNQYGIVALASATDPYINAEETYQLTQRFLVTLLKHRFPVLMITKSEMILRDVEILKEIDRQAIHADDLKGKLNRGAIVSFSFSTLDPEIASTLEPGAPLPLQRLETMRKCKDAGLFVGMNCIPVLPFISDSDEKLEQLITAGKDYGADYILIGGLTLFGSNPADSKVLYQKFLERKYPKLTTEYKKLYRIFPYPPADYIAQLNVRADHLCERIGLRRGIL